MSDPLKDTARFADLRIDYGKGALFRASLHADPLEQLKTWIDDAVEAEVAEPNAMSLATVSASGKPTNRILLLKGMDARGFFIYTSHLSRKAREIEKNPDIAANFLWKPLQRQVCITGRAEKLERDIVEAFFASRPYDSQIGSWVSKQSEEIPGRNAIEQRRAEVVAEYPQGTAVPCPDFWGGYRVIPDTIEFWQGRPGRLHDRLVYTRTKSVSKDKADTWQISRLSP